MVSAITRARFTNLTTANSFLAKIGNQQDSAKVSDDYETQAPKILQNAQWQILFDLYKDKRFRDFLKGRGDAAGVEINFNLRSDHKDYYLVIENIIAQSSSKKPETISADKLPQTYAYKIDFDDARLPVTRQLVIDRANLPTLVNVAAGSISFDALKLLYERINKVLQKQIAKDLDKDRTLKDSIRKRLGLPAPGLKPVNASYPNIDFNFVGGDAESYDVKIGTVWIRLDYSNQYEGNNPVTLPFFAVSLSPETRDKVYKVSHEDLKALGQTVFPKIYNRTKNKP